MLNIIAFVWFADMAFAGYAFYPGLTALDLDSDESAPYAWLGVIASQFLVASFTSKSLSR